MTMPDMSPDAITRRLKQVDELRELCLALAGSRLKRPWGVPPAQDFTIVVQEPTTAYKNEKPSGK